MQEPGVAPPHADERSAWARERLTRERAQARLFAVLATVLLPAWIPFDFALEPAHAWDMLWMRLADVALGVAVLLRLRSAAIGLREVQALAVLKLTTTGIAIALMLPLVGLHFWPYLFGFSLVFWGSAAVYSIPALAVGAGYGVVLAVAASGLAFAPSLRSADELVGGGFYLASAAVICLGQVATRRRLERDAFRSTHAIAEASRRVLESETLKDQLFANVSHELRTPLTLVLGPTERLLAAPELPPPLRADLEVVALNARTLLRHVNDLLDLSRLEVGALAPARTRVDLARLVRRVAAHFEVLAQERAVRYVVEAPPSLAAEMDPRQVERVLLNLLSNAFKVTPEGGVVRCSLVASDGERARLEVADSGPGIAPEHRALVFERFRQVEGGPTRKLGGTGLGLTIARDFVTQHGGTIAIGDAPEGGASFRVDLPLHPPDTEAAVVGEEHAASAAPALAEHVLAELREEPSAEEPAAAPADAPRVLVIEDNPEMNRFVRECLRGLRTEAAHDGRTGLERAIELRPDLVITDVMMPEVSGDELVAALRTRRELDDVPILVLTAKVDDRLRVELLRRGAQDFVTKPFSAAELRARSDNLISIRRTRAVLEGELAEREESLEAMARQVTSQKRALEVALDGARVARDQAERASAMKTTFLRMVSHELRTPLSALLLQLERLERGAPLPADKQHVLTRMVRCAGVLRDLIESLLEHARIQSGVLRTELEAFDLAALAGDVIEDLAGAAQAKGLALTLEREAEDAWLTSDRRLVRLVLVNLVGNALKFTREGGVTVSVGREGERRRVIVRDTGPGIPPEERARIFEPFEQLEPVRRKHTTGVGLGLALVREIVGALQGSIELTSEVGEGSAFTVLLPALERESEHEVVYAEGGVPGRG